MQSAEYRKALREATARIKANPGAPLRDYAEPKRSMSKEAAIKKADSLFRSAEQIMSPIVPGQPILNTRDRNRRERAWDKIHQANLLLKEHDL